MLELDHIAVTGETLDAASTHIETATGLPMAPGGSHDLMGTHNTLMGLGGHYLEAIAADPDAPKPPHARWFNIDNFQGPPRLTNWILRTDNLEDALARLGSRFGAPLAVQRGALRWRMAVPESGVLPWGGFGPALMEWGEMRGSAQHPAQSLPQTGAVLTEVTLLHPQADEIRETLAPIMSGDMVNIRQADTPSLTATLTRKGRAFTLP